MIIEQVPNCGYVAFGRLDDFQYPLLTQEEHIAKGATPMRLREIKGGRSAARLALRAGGFYESPILAGPHGDPIWPAGVCGSLAHTSSHVAAVIAPLSCYQSVGIDVGDERRLGEALERNVLGATEKEELQQISAQVRGDIGNLAFCAKEAFFKCQFPIRADAEVSFSDVVLRRDPIRSDVLAVASIYSDPLDALTKTRIYVLRLEAQLVCLAVLGR